MATIGADCRSSLQEQGAEIREAQRLQGACAEGTGE